jgi:arginyl-tRNA synthetase
MNASIDILVRDTLLALAQDPVLATLAEMDPQIERTRDRRHGDFTSNVAMRAAKTLGRPPREIAALIVAAIPDSDLIERVDIAGPGFVNFTLARVAYFGEILGVLTTRDAWGRRETNAGKRALVEFVSANPTGPLHVGHGRHAAFGACIANLLRATGYQVDTEYYVNDAGRQMNILAVSVWLRYLQAHGVQLEFPSNCYQADYCREIAHAIAADDGGMHAESRDAVRALLDTPGEDDEARLDALIALAQEQLGEAGFTIFFDAAIDAILEDIRDDLEEFGVHYDRWYSERTLVTSGAIENGIEALRARGLLYERDGATWFRTSDFGDDKDRVVVRENGATTYFASDIAYHKEKFERGYDVLINIFGSDHHGYVARLRAALAGLGKEPDELEIRLVQFVVLFRGTKKVQMSTRGGKYVTLRDLRDEVGNDAARFFYVSRSNDQHLDFDLELATSQSNDNPVYYVQYAHARIASLLRRLEESGISLPKASIDALMPLRHESELNLMRAVSRYPEIVQLAADNRAPQTLVHYLRELAAEFHSFYNDLRIIDAESAERAARALLAAATRQVLANGLTLLGVSAPNSM